MVAELKEVISKVEQLKDDEQRKIAKMLNEEIQWMIPYKATRSH